MPDRKTKEQDSGNDPLDRAVTSTFAPATFWGASSISKTLINGYVVGIIVLLCAGNAFADEYVDRIRQQRASARAQAYLTEAKSALQRGDYVKTIRVLSAAIGNGAGGEAYKLRAQAYYLRGAYAEATADLTRVIDSGAADPADRVLRADIYSARLDYEGALDDYNASIQSDPLYLDAYRGRATIYMAREKYDLAIRDLQVVLRSEPTDAEALYNAGIACMLADLPTAAKAFFDNAMQVETSDRWRQRIEGAIARLQENSAHERAVGGLAGYLSASSREAQPSVSSADDLRNQQPKVVGPPGQLPGTESRASDASSLRKDLTSPRPDNTHLTGDLSGTHVGFQWTFHFDSKGRNVSGVLRIRGPAGFEETHLCTGTLDRGLVEMSDRTGYRLQGRITENLRLVGTMSTSRGQSFSVDVPLKE
jgi:tetratricopeptide (TPR) repeat protein